MLKPLVYEKVGVQVVRTATVVKLPVFLLSENTKPNDCAACLLEKHFGTSSNNFRWLCTANNSREALLKIESQSKNSSSATSTTAHGLTLPTSIGWRSPTYSRRRPLNVAPPRTSKAANSRRTGENQRSSIARRRLSFPSNNLADTGKKRASRSHSFRQNHEPYTQDPRKYDRFIHVSKLDEDIQTSNCLDSMMLVRAKTTSHFKRSPTPPPVRSRSIKLNEQISCPAYHERISVGSETVLQLLSSSAKFNSTQSLCNRRKMTKRSGFFAGLKFWSKSHKSNTTNESQSKDDAYQMESTSTMSRINNNANTCCSPHQGNSSNTSSCQPELAVYESDPLKARLFEEYEEIFTSDDLNDSPKKMQRAHLGLKRRKSDKKRRNSFMLAPRVSVTEEIPSGLEELIHEPQNLKDFLSVKYLVLSFRKFLLSEFSEENLDFYIECDEYKGISSSQLIKEVASNIYEKYIKVDSAREINITVPIRKEIEAKLAAPDMIIFDHARNHIYHMMNNGAFRRYLQSDMYENLKKSFPVSTGNRKRRSDFIHSSFNKKLRR